jgi:sodium-dependent phosphate transporter
MTMLAGGMDCVIWYKETDSFPYVGGVSGIVLSWFLSPIFSAIVAGSLFFITRLSVLRRENSFDKTYVLLPVLVGLTLLLNSFFIIYKGGKGIGLDDISESTAILVSLGIGVTSGLAIVPFIPFLKSRVEQRFSENNSPERKCMINNEIAITDDMSKCKKCITHIRNNINYDVRGEIINNEKVKDIHDNSEKFDERTEESFKYLQIFTAICDSFSHGANDVANAIGPYAAIVSIYINDGDMGKKVDMGDHAYWILSMGGIGITFGLLLYGYKIIKAIGVKLCCITPSRGYSIELGSATIIIIGSRLGIPLSTTHCQVGATMGVAALDDLKKCSGINWRIAFKVFAGWIITLAVVGSTSALITAQGIYAPSKNVDECINYFNITN